MNSTKYYMGIAALQDDSAAAMIDQHGNIINFSHEQKRTGIKNDGSWPTESIKWCLADAKRKDANFDADDVEYAYYEKPWRKFFRRVQNNPRNFKTFFREAREAKQKFPGIKYVGHHHSHALAACATSPWDDCMYLIIDNIGEFKTTSWGKFTAQDGIDEIGNISYPDSLGVFAAAFCRWMGLKPNREEHLIMSASCLGQPNHYDELRKLIDYDDDGYFYLTEKIHFGLEDILGHDLPADEWFDWCASFQVVLEEAILNLFKIINREHGKQKIAYGGVLAQNSIVNSLIMESGLVEDLWIMPCPGDSGSALGAACAAAGLTKLKPTDWFLGPDMDGDSAPTTVLIREVVKRLADGEIVAWIQGGEEAGKRSLGHRAVLADPRNPSVSSKIDGFKTRKMFRPFSASVLESDAWMYFGGEKVDPFGNYFVRVRDPLQFPAISYHNGYTQAKTVAKSTDSFSRLMEFWKQSQVCSVLLNATFCDNGTPTINNRKDAILYLQNNQEIDCLVIGNRLYYREFKPGLDDGQQWIIDSIDYSGGADFIVHSRL